MLRGERVDAARNRQGILDAADRLFSETSAPEKISMEDVARAAGLGKGTLFRRFGDRATLIRAVYARRIEPLRRQIESGPPPLGPAAPRRDRVVAILAAIAQLKIENTHLALALEGGDFAGSTSVYSSPSYRDVHQLLTSLLDSDLGPGARWTAHALLATVRADLVRHLVEEEGMNGPELRERIAWMIETILPSG